MPDNIAVTAGTGTTIATDQVGSVHYQKIKLADGTADSENMAKVDAGGSMQAAIASLPSVTIGVLPAIPNGNNAIGTMILTSLPFLPSGTNTIGNVNIASLTSLPVFSVNKNGIAYTPISKFFTASYPSESTVWDPTAGKKFVVTDLIVSASAAGSCILKDGTGGTTLATLMFAANGGAVSNFNTPWQSASADNNLTITPSAGTQYITVNGYEI